MYVCVCSCVYVYVRVGVTMYAYTQAHSPLSHTHTNTELGVTLAGHGFGDVAVIDSTSHRSSDAMAQVHILICFDMNLFWWSKETYQGLSKDTY